MDPLEIAVTLARIETKLDAEIAAKNDHETRIRVLEGCNYVTPRQLAAYLSVMLTVLGVATPFILLAL